MDLSQIRETQKAQNLSMKKEEINRSLNSKITTCANDFLAIFSQFSYKLKKIDKIDEKLLSELIFVYNYCNFQGRVSSLSVSLLKK